MNKLSNIIIISYILASGSSCGQTYHRNMKNQYHKHSYTNELARESSPYLLQHAHNPVNWYPWGDMALKLARQENKMLIISIGYAACHWCHVMEHESFEDTAVARLMNENFISIKVNFDTEKRLVSMFKVRGLPDNWFFSKDRKGIKHQPGYIPPEKFLVMLKKI